MSQNSSNTGFSCYFSLMMEGSGALSVTPTNGSGFGSGSETLSIIKLCTVQIPRFFCIDFGWCGCGRVRPA
jgi:hypothetical protein